MRSIRGNKLAGTLFVCMVLTALGASCAKANTFPWYNDPFSFPNFGTTSRTGNDLFWTFGTQNTGTMTHDIAIIVPIFNTVSGNLVWDQTQGGWSGSVGTNSLLVTVLSPTGRLPWSDVADGSGLTQETFHFFNQTTKPSDSYPFVDLGLLVPNQSASFTWKFNFKWGGSGSGVPLVNAYVATIAPNPFSAPEPSTLMLLGTGLLGVVGAARRKWLV